MKNNTIVSASDMNYRWGVWLLVASIRKANMDEPVLIGTYNWSKEWIEDIHKFPNVETVDLPAMDRRSVTCQKPEIMLRADNEFVTWVDCDGIFTGNCSDRLSGMGNEIYIRSRTPSEVVELYHRKRAPNDDPEEIPVAILDIWRRDVGELSEPRRKRSCSAGIICVHKSRLDFLGKWRAQMMKILPPGVDVVAKGNIGYFQTDDSILNSLLLFAADAPEITTDYRADDLTGPHYIHFAFNPKPWIMWNPRALRHYSLALDIVEWAESAGYSPRAPRPYTLNRDKEWLARMLAPFSRNVNRFKKLKRKVLGR
jgi:hypothetical protein